MAFDDTDDPILDALLDEVLAGRSPPDLAAQILQSAAPRRYGDQSAHEHASPEPPPVLAGVQNAFAGADAAPMVQPRASGATRSKRKQPLSAALTVGLALAIVGLGLTIGIVSLLRSDKRQMAAGPKSSPATDSSRPAEVAIVPKLPA